MLASVEVLVVVLCERDLLFVVLELQIRHVIFRLDRRVINTPRLLLLLSLFPVFLELLRRLLRPTLEVLGADFPAQDASLSPTALFYAQRYLL